MNRNDEMVLKFREVLKQTERFEPDGLWEYQKSLLTPLLLHARAHSPFYRTRLDAVFNGDEIDFGRWREIPILTRAEAQTNEKTLAAKAVPPHLGTVSADETSGSTGRPLRYLKNGLMDVAALAMTDRLYRWWDFDGFKTMASFVSPRRGISKPEGDETFGWQTGALEGRHLLRETTGDAEGHARWLAKQRPDYLVSYASMIEPIAATARDRDIGLAFAKVIARGGIVTGETRAVCREIFGCSLVDQYGADEIGQIACECPRCGQYHINSEVVRVELLDENNKPVSSGQTGRVVLTGFYNYAMPLIRYEIGDYATRAQSGHECAVALPSISKIVGRYRNTFTLADGRILFPNMPMKGFRTYLPYTQIQVVQTDYDRLLVRYVADESGKQPDGKGLEAWLKESLDPCFSVQLEEVASIPAASDGKYEDFVSLVARQ